MGATKYMTTVVCYFLEGLSAAPTASPMHYRPTLIGFLKTKKSIKCWKQTEKCTTSEMQEQQTCIHVKSGANEGLENMKHLLPAFTQNMLLSSSQSQFWNRFGARLLILKVVNK